ncbi:biotin transporter BioY [Caldanaerobius polysaccharolyticus]|uniref:biotin transporter BioY n=1 Tax=Caldanaerobius polysaccharolyticus TaxID=44256 RepID=UPI00047BFA5D|nr:biotin transporter BioY [Caldanaerobius polysaccharolyticus]
MKLKEMAYAGLFAAITAVMAQISIPLPFTPVPITFQVLAVCMAGAVLGSKLGALSMLVYDLLGAIGIPVFAGFKGGFSAIVGPSGGYIIAFPVAAFFAGYILERAKGYNKLMSFISMFVGLVLIYLVGMVQLAVVAKMSLLKAFYAGVVPFVPLDIVKVVIAALVVEPLRKSIMSFSNV